MISVIKCLLLLIVGWRNDVWRSIEHSKSIEPVKDIADDNATHQSWHTQHPDVLGNHFGCYSEDGDRKVLILEKTDHHDSVHKCHHVKENEEILKQVTDCRWLGALGG